VIFGVLVLWYHGRSNCAGWKRWILSLSRDNRAEHIEPNFPVAIQDFDVARGDWVLIVHPTETGQSEFLCEKAVVSNVYQGSEKKRIADLSNDSSTSFFIEKQHSNDLKPFLKKSRYSQLHLISWEFWTQNFEFIVFEVQGERELGVHHPRSIEQLASDIWKELVGVPPSESITYQELGNRIGMNK
jgi:hypothetical protein